ncbi:MAG: hypothetical protein ACR2NM_15705 [Bythopirellula sp.]
MDSTYTLGLLLIGLSAFLLATHWQQWRESDAHPKLDRRAHDFLIRTVRRRAFASSLLGMVGVTLMAYETVPRTPRSITAYLLGLLLMTLWILWLACLDFMASRRFQEQRQLDQLAEKLRRAKREPSNTESADR